jgi:soluble lytic murein transglycosylase-like protein
VIHQESAYRNRAVSHAGAQGLMQIMPGTGRMLGVRPSDLHDPAANVDAGARLLKQLYFKYDGNFDLVLAAYNAGEGAVAKYGNKIPPYRETQNYVKSVMTRYYKLVEEQGKVAPR